MVLFRAYQQHSRDFSYPAQACRVFGVFGLDDERKQGRGLQDVGCHLGLEAVGLSKQTIIILEVPSFSRRAAGSVLVCIAHVC